MRLDFKILPQPDNTTCGPTCLQAVYQHFGDVMPLQQVIREAFAFEGGGTLAVFLGVHALKRGYSATIHTYNLVLFDPSWFAAPGVNLAEKLRAQAAVKSDPRLRHATEGYLEFLSLGGRIEFQDLTTTLVRRHLKKNVPILTGLSATYLYDCRRERDADMEYDDIVGVPQGHFVVLCGYDAERREVIVADPQHPNPRTSSPLYSLPIQRVIHSILLGVLTYDANLLTLNPPVTPKEHAPRA
ncbi:MAG: hypothetical protein KDA32_00825 [Phycisphaerales bacterium]|nr:hypothetical protein [Phycisphaerales bacterium]